jgi:imidazolonepropionase-like amidohydrolase
MVTATGDLLLANGLVVDPEAGITADAQNILVRDGRVAEIGRFVLPGLIDAHVHVTAATADLGAMTRWSPTYVTAHASRILRGMLARGFTTVRDVGGADYGLAAAVEDGLFAGPRIVFGGRALSQTGGHGDNRGRGEDQPPACHSPDLCQVCDGVTEVRRTARDELRRGAAHIKIMLSGGVASPTDRVDSTGFSIEEITAIVEEAGAANRYVTGHAYTAEAINRGLRCGVRCIEHGNLLDESSVALFRERDAFYVPTLATYAALAKEGPAAGLPEVSHRKVFDVLDAGLHALELAHRAGVNIAYGTDLLGDMHVNQLSEFTLRGEVQSPAEILRAATSTAARLLNMEGIIGTLALGAHADMVVVEENPLEDIDVLSHLDQRLQLLCQGGAIVENRLN